MKVLVILNGISRKKKVFESTVRRHLEERFHAQIIETEYAGHAELLAAEGISAGFDIILSAGGDGTMHQVVNGVLTHESPTAAIGLIPLGSGNDLARSLGVTLDVRRIITQIEKVAVKEIDIGRASVRDSDGNHVTRYFVNECSMGMGPEVVRRVNKGGGRGLAAGLMYTRAIIGTFLSLRPEKIELNADGLSWSGKSRVLAVANGRSFGHGIYIAPHAKMDDKRLNLFVAANPPLLKFLLLLQALKRPAESMDDCLTYAETRTADVRTERPLPVEADGELLGFSPLKCEIAKTRLRVLI